MAIMKWAFTILLCLFFSTSSAQSDTELSGSWVRVLETAHEDEVRQSLSIVDDDYLKIEFQSGGQLRIYASHQANGVQVAYQTRGSTLSFGLGRQFRIEDLQEDRLILLDLTDGKVTDHSKRHYYLSESVFLDALPYPEEDRVIIGDDTAYIASKKLYPIFQTTNTPDFHIFIHNQIKSSYRMGENYFQATFMIRPDGSIDHIMINHRIGKANDKRALKAIMASAGRWRMPQLNGQDVNIIMTIEDLFTRHSERVRTDPLKIDLNHSAEDPEVYTSYFNLAIRKILRKQTAPALQYLKLCEDRKPDDPNLYYLRYLLYTDLGDEQAAKENLAPLKRSRLRYLLK
ncbi:MAG: hypothetical protein Roseis2KO_59600 [Roseivirga sp.]